jgi:hypothetical protein
VHGGACTTGSEILKISIDTRDNQPQDVGQDFGPTQGIGNRDRNRAPVREKQNSEEANLMPAKKKAKKKKKH